MITALAVALLLFGHVSCLPKGSLVDVQPQQVHISYGDNPSTMVVTWSTYANTDTVVKYCYCENQTCGCSPTQTVAGTSTPFVDGDVEHRTQYIHRVWLDSLKPGQFYKYQAGGGGLWSDAYVIQAMRIDPAFAPRFVVYGDLGLENAQSVPRILDDVNNGMYDAVLHVGDMCYDMHENQSYKGDAFMNFMQPIAARLPYMVCPGNHEETYNFSNYVSRFTMPNTDDNLFYSYDVGLAHIIAISTEVYFYINYGIAQAKNQFQWLERDLQYANSKENRTLHPWIIIMGHRPMYCTNDDVGNCVWGSYVVRDGLPLILPYAMEPLLDTYGVDLALWAHEHSYERFWPVYNGVVFNGSYEQPYTDPKAPVHIVTGSAGNRENLDSFGPPFPYTAFRASDYGYGRMTINNATHLYFEQVSDDKDGSVIDKFWLIKHTHAPYASLRN